MILVLDRRRHLRNTARLWAVVFAANVLGAVCFALLMVLSPALGPGVRHALVGLGVQAAHGSWGHLFWAGVAGGWIIALVVCLVTASRFAIAQVALIWLGTFVIGAAHLAHGIAGSGEIVSAALAGDVSGGAYVYWLSAATIGNAVGGVVIVTLLNYGQVVGTGHDHDLSERTLVEAERTAMRVGRRRARSVRDWAKRSAERHMSTTVALVRARPGRRAA